MNRKQMEEQELRQMIERTVAQVSALDAHAMEEARARQATLTKPPGSLGRLEDLAIWLAGVTGQPVPRPLSRRAVLVLAADHGVALRGVSAYPREVTAQMVHNFAAGGAAINALAGSVGARVVVADLGVASDLSTVQGLRHRAVAQGTADMAGGPAMTPDQARRSVEAGLSLLEDEAAGGLDVVCTGEMGIGNTTAAAAITAVIAGSAVEAVTGRGTGVDDARLQHKIETVKQALEINRPDPGDALAVLAAVGGFEIGGLAGVIIGAAARRIPVVLDGYIAGAAALIAVTLCPAAGAYLLAAHRSVEPGHARALDHLRLVPLLDLHLRLGEGTGAVLALPLLDAAVAAHAGMATFDSAGVAGKTAD
jgi:nicotinate-nucleotide--dimethylbenzimidazole phosphoribosyltransferase